MDSIKTIVSRDSDGTRTRRKSSSLLIISTLHDLVLHFFSDVTLIIMF